MMKDKNTLGFTLIELMITLVVIAILAAVAYPSYINHVRKARRADAKAALTEIAQKEEVYYAENTRYTADMRDLGFDLPNDNPVTPGSGNEAFYRVRIDGPTAVCPLTNCFGLRATPIGDQVHDAVSAYMLLSNGYKRTRIHGALLDGWPE